MADDVAAWMENFQTGNGQKARGEGGGGVRSTRIEMHNAFQDLPSAAGCFFEVTAVI